MKGADFFHTYSEEYDVCGNKKAKAEGEKWKRADPHSVLELAGDTIALALGLLTFYAPTSEGFFSQCPPLFLWGLLPLYFLVGGSSLFLDGRMCVWFLVAAMGRQLKLLSALRRFMAAASALVLLFSATDSKYRTPEIALIQFRTMMDEAEALEVSHIFERIIVQVYDQAILEVLNHVFISSITFSRCI